MVNDMSKQNDAAVLNLLSTFGAGVLSLAQEGISSQERMHAASLQASQALLEAALKGAENCSPEQYQALLGALERVTVAGIEAEKEVHLSSLENGKAFIKGQMEVYQAVVAHAPAMLEVAKVRAEADATRAEAEGLNAKSRSKEAKAKVKNADSEALKAETARETAREARETAREARKTAREERYSNGTAM